jgi:hypothetical protein
LSQTCSKAASDPSFTRKRFMAMNMELAPSLVDRNNLASPTIVAN